jgi:metal-dependent HD superfamily phosphatase/phosphodiesterase
MRYISIHNSLDLIARNGRARYHFREGKLEIGDLTSNVAPNVIDPMFGDVDLELQMLRTDIVPPTLESIGLNYIFFEAPDLALTVEGGYYRVVRGTVTVNGRVYYEGERFKHDVGAVVVFSVGAAVYQDLPIWLYEAPEDNHRWELFKYFLLSHHKDESWWIDTTWEAAIRPPGWIRD